jgi:cellulose synthase operon protein C
LCAFSLCRPKGQSEAGVTRYCKEDMTDMGRSIAKRVVLCMALSSAGAFAQPARGSKESPEKRVAKDTELKKKEVSLAPDKSLAGDTTRKKEKRDDAPVLQYDQFRLQLEGQVRSKRLEQIADLEKIIELSRDPKEAPTLLFRLGELYWEESKYFFFEANRKDDDKIKALNNNDEAGQQRAEGEKAELMGKSKEAAQKAVGHYSTIVQQYKDYERTDEVLYFLGLNLMEMGDEKRAILAYNRLVEKFPKSRYLPDAYLARGEYFFNNSKSKRDQLEKALENYKNAAKFPENQVYGYALYKQGWCYFNMVDYEKAQDQFKAVVLYAEVAGAEEVEGPKKKGGKSSRSGLAKEARTDYVRSYSRGGGTPQDAKDKFSRLTKVPDDLRLMLKQLANLYYEDGKDKEAALTFDMLIKDRPTSPEAPGFQAKIIDCVMRAGNKRMTVQQVRRLVKLTDDVNKANGSLSDKDKKALDEAKELSERTISNLAVNWHNEAKKTRDEETFGFANDVYSDYLTLFPDNPKAYDLRFFYAELLNDNLLKFDRAAEEYTRTMMADVKRLDKGEKAGKWMNNAAYNSILAWTEVVKKAKTDGAIKPVGAAEPGKKFDIPLQEKALLEACDRYLKYVEKGDKKVEIAYKAAKIYYDYNWLDEAVQRFADIALKSPDYKFEDGQRAGEISANLVLDSYNLLGDWAKVNEWARRFYQEPALAQGKFRDDLAKLIEQSSFKLINQLEAKKDYAKAGEAYMTFVSDFPKSDLADKSLFNASIDFFNAKMLDRAIDVRKQLIQKYPKSQYVPQTMYALAEGYEAITDFDASADYYEAYASNYQKGAGGGGSSPKPKKGRAKAAKKEAPAASDQVWEEAKAQDALFNAGIFREGLGQTKQALRDRELYLELWPNSKDAEAVSKSIIDLTEKAGTAKQASKLLEDYEKQYVKDPNKVLWAEGKLAKLYEEKTKNAKAAKGVYTRVLGYYEKLPKRQKESLDISALDTVARATFVDNETDWKRYSGVKLKWTRAANIGEIRGSAAAKGRALEELKKAYTKTVQLKSADPAICALYKIGLGYDQYVEQMENPPMPKDLPEENRPEVLAGFAEQAKPLRDAAAEFFSLTVGQSQQFDVFNTCTTAALEKLRTKYRPEQFPPMREDVAEMKADEKTSMAIGQDVLATVQTVPVVSADKARELKDKAREVGRNVNDVASLPEPTSAPKSTAAAPKPENRPAPAAKPSTAAAKKPPASSGDEPEEP